jgi:magnesium transporter
LAEAFLPLLWFVFFEGSLQEQLMLAAFIPAVVYIADAVGAQTQTIFVRSLALTQTLNVKKYILRESKVAFFLSGLLGFLSFLVVFVWLGLVKLGLVLGLAIGLTILMASGIGLLFPWLLQKLKYDPAIASGPFATVVRDITSLLVYFTVAMLLL